MPPSMRITSLSLVLLLSGALATLPARAATQLPRPVPYVTGGIGLDEREALMQEAKTEGYNLKVVTAATGGAYLASIMLRIVDEQGSEVLRTAMDGPWLFTKLPPGTYTVTATLGDSSHSQKVRLPATGLREVVLRWRVPEGVPPR